MNTALPVLDGVSPSCKWLPAGLWETLLDFLIERYPSVSLDTWVSRMDKGQVVDESGCRLHPESPYRAGTCVYYYRELGSEIHVPFEEIVLYQDDHLLVVDKPHFLPVVPSGRFLHETLLVRLRKKGYEHLSPIHRIDRETAGIVMFSLNPATVADYISLFRRRQVKKIYEAIAPFRSDLDFPLTRRSRIVPGEPFFRMKEVEGEPNSETHIHLLRQMNDLALYQLSPVTGRKHQLRVHMSALGIPIVSDSLYPEPGPAGFDDFGNPLKLLAKSVSFQDPVTGEERYLESGRALDL